MSGKDDVRMLLERLYDSFGSGDPSVWTDTLGDDVVGIGTDPDEWWEGRDIIVKVGSAQVEQMSAAGMSVQPGTARVFDSGDVVWAVDQPTLHLRDGATVPMRFTLVATRHGGALQIRHFHMSTGTTNEESLGEELPTS